MMTSNLLVTLTYLLHSLHSKTLTSAASGTAAVGAGGGTAAGGTGVAGAGAAVGLVGDSEHA